jgi:hypothetical protein
MLFGLWELGTLTAHDCYFHPNTGTSWLDSDVLFLKLALERGMTIAAVAGFPGRDEDEVQEKAEELRRRP